MAGRIKCNVLEGKNVTDERLQSHTSPTIEVSNIRQVRTRVFVDLRS